MYVCISGKASYSLIKINFIFVLEIQFGFSDLQFTREQGIETIAFEATEDEASLIATLKMAKKEGLRTYILTSSAVSVSHVMKQADIMQLTTGNFHWYIPNVFVDPESFPDIAKKGLRLTSLTSPVITPLVRRLMLSYGPTTMTQEEQQRRIYDDVIRGLTRLAVDVIAKSCQNRKPECTVIEENCRPLPNDIDLTEYTSDTATGSANLYGTRSFFLEITPRIQEAVYYPDVELVSQSCSNFKWPQYLKDEIAGISGRVTDLSPMSINYNASVDVCRYKSTYKWAFENDSCSYNLVAGMQIEQANIVLVQEYSRSNDKLPVTVGVYNWDKTGEFNPLYHPFTLEDIKLPERQIRVCAVWRKPWLSWKEIKGETKFEGFLYDVIEELSKHLNFTYDIIMHPYFAAKQTATEDEIERMIYEIFQNGTCDFFLYTKSLRGGSLGQSDTADASLAYQHPSMYLLTKRSEKTESISIWQFMTPFREESWLCLWSSYILISLLMAWINKNNPFEYQKIAPSFGPNSSPADHLGVLNSLWFTFSSIVQQGVDIVPRSRAAKTLTGAWWFFGLTIITAYTANMTLFMTQGNKGGIKTLDALSSQIEFAYGILEGDPILTLFLPHAKERPYSVIYNYFKRNWNTSVFATQDEAFAEIQKGNFYLLSSFESTVDALSTSCSFDKVGTGFYQYQFALPFPKGSLLLPVFNDCIARLRDIGILTTLEEKWFSIETKCEQDGSSKTLENQLDIKAFTGMYVFLLLGCGIGGIFCLIETGYVSFGGIRGLYGNARFYEFQENRREHRKTLDQLEKEFEGWEGGWDVWKFREWSNDGDHNALKGG
ncbi:glutamate receptor 4-like [Ciona intestinalis]